MLIFCRYFQTLVLLPFSSQASVSRLFLRFSIFLCYRPVHPLWTNQKFHFLEFPFAWCTYKLRYLIQFILTVASRKVQCWAHKPSSHMSMKWKTYLRPMVFTIMPLLTTPFTLMYLAHTARPLHHDYRTASLRWSTGAEFIDCS